MVLVSSGCTSLPEDLGRGDIDRLMADRGLRSESVGGAAILASLEGAPLSVEHAISIALANNQGLQATYAELGFAVADVYEAGRIRNPFIAGAVMEASPAAERVKVSYGIAVSLTDLLTMPARKRLATAEFAATKQAIGNAVWEVAVDAEEAYYRFVSAKQIAELHEEIATASRLNLALAERLHDAGVLDDQRLASEQAVCAEAQLAALKADAHAFDSRGDLAAVMGVSVAVGWDAPARLYITALKVRSVDELLELARRNRLDLASANARAKIRADELGVTEWTRWLGELEIGALRDREIDNTVLAGPAFGWEMPVFTQNRDSLLRADAEMKQALAEVAGIAMMVENEVQQAFAAVENARLRVLLYRNQLIPLRISATERAQEEESASPLDVFEVSARKQEEYSVYEEYLEAVLDLLIAHVDLGAAVGTTPPRENANNVVVDVADLIARHQDRNRNVPAERHD